MPQERLQVETTDEREGACAAVPPGTPEWITPELVRLTQKVWNPRYKTSLTRDEAITIIQNAGRLFDLLTRE
ncbi:MAG: hypothetical protein BroJett003_01810 [Planctomycetota bacterium]|nr:MAG: hypothetical protein BroJett003_01810 [Planctomycetota bacterium]